MWKLKTNVTPVILKALGIIKKKHYNEQIPGFKREKVELKVNESQYKQSRVILNFSIVQNLLK